MPDFSELEQRAFKNLLRKEREYELQIQLALRDALVQMRGEMVRIYDKYSVGGILTKAEMTKYNRYANMESQMLGILNPALKSNLKTITRLTPNQYQASFFQYAWAMDNGNGVRLNWGIINIDTITEQLANPWLDIAKTRYSLNGKLLIRAALNNRLTQGKDYTQMAKDLKIGLNRTFYEAQRIVRTEGQYAINAGQFDSYLRAKQQGIEGNEVWDATLDGDTRPAHGAADGQKKGDDGMFIVDGEKTPFPAWEGMSAGNRIQCRCHLRFEIEGYSPQLRRSREQGVIPYQTYDEWVKNYGPPVKRK